MRSFSRVGLLTAVLVTVGCAGGTDVSGKVTFQGKPVVYGTVVLIGSDGIPRSGAIQPDGSFQVKGAKLGKAKVAVSSPPPPGAAKGGRPKVGREAEDRAPADAGEPVNPELAKNWVQLPDKYADATKSELTAEIKAGTPLELTLR
jgi:hypothetical protein